MSLCGEDCWKGDGKAVSAIAQAKERCERIRINFARFSARRALENRQISPNSSQMSYKDDRREEILNGKRVWRVRDAGSDLNTFYAEFVVPLRELRAEGMFEQLEEREGSYREVKMVNRIEIVGAIKLA